MYCVTVLEMVLLYWLLVDIFFFQCKSIVPEKNKNTSFEDCTC